MPAFKEFELSIRDTLPHGFLIARWRNAIVASPPNKHGHFKGWQAIVGIMALARFDLATGAYCAAGFILSDLEAGERFSNQGLEFLRVGSLPGCITASVAKFHDFTRPFL